MVKQSYEFQYMSPQSKQKLLACKTALMALILGSLYALVAPGGGDLSMDLVSCSALFAGIFGYLNLINLRGDVKDLFEPPYRFVGYEFIVPCVICNVASFFV